MDTFKTRLKALRFKEKLVLIGGLLVMVGAFLPWYKDIDRFRTGDTFLGVTGPLYLAGLIVLMAGAVSFGIILLKLMDKRDIKLPIQESYIHLFGAGLSILMIILTTSVYFHPKFGINLTEKTIGVGMLMAMVGVGFVILGSILTIKKRNVSFEEEGKLEPLISMDDRSQSKISPRDSEPRKVTEKSPFETQKSINSFLEEEEGTLNTTNTPPNE